MGFNSSFPTESNLWKSNWRHILSISDFPSFPVKNLSSFFSNSSHSWSSRISSSNKGFLIDSPSLTRIPLTLVLTNGVITVRWRSSQRKSYKNENNLSLKYVPFRSKMLILLSLLAFNLHTCCLYRGWASVSVHQNTSWP